MSDEIRSRRQFEDGFWVGDWFVEPMLNRVRREGEEEEVQLEPKVMEVLLCLADRPGKTVTKKQFKDEVWTDTVVTDDVLSRCISELRKVFGDDSRDPSYIETIRKTGYRLIAPVRTEDPPPSSSSTSTDVPAPKPSTEADNPSSEENVSDRLSRSLSVSWPRARNAWVILAERVTEQKWILAFATVVGALLLIGLMYWSNGTTESEARLPNSATPLTSFPGEEFDPALSSTGRQIVFGWRNADSLFQNIYLMQRGADRPLQLSADTTVDWSPSWSPEGRFVAYARELNGEHQVSIVPSIGGRGRLVARMSDRRIHSVDWSPDTTQTVLAISAQQAPHRAFALSTLIPETDSVTSLTAPPLWSVGDTTPTFSPDGSRIAFVRGVVDGVENIFTVPTSGTEPAQQVTRDSTNIHGLTWTEDGEDIIYSAEREGVTGLWQVDSEGGTPSLIRAASEGTLFNRPTMSGDRLAYTQQSAQLDIWTLRRSSRYASFQAERVTSSTQEDTYPSLSPTDEPRLAFISKRSGDPEVWVGALDDSMPTQVTSMEGPSLRSVSWSSNGDRLSFIAREDGHSNLFVVSDSGGPVQQLTDTTAEVIAPRWSRNDRWIYFASNKTGRWEIWRISVETGKTEQVTVGGAVAAQESVSGSTLYLVRSDTTGIWAASLDTTSLPIQTQSQPYLTEDSLITEDSLSSLLVSPSETHASTGPMVEEAEEAPGLRQVVDQFDPSDRLNWWVGQNGLYFLQHRRFRTTVLTYVDLTSGRTVPLYTFPDWDSDQYISVGPDGNLIAYTHVARRESDVMLMDSVQP